MTFAYPRNAGTSSLPSFDQYQPARSSNILTRVWDHIPSVAKQWLPTGFARRRFGKDGESEDIKTTALNLCKRIFTLPTGIILLWIFTIRWGERTVFEDSINKCLWDSWEEWVS